MRGRWLALIGVATGLVALAISIRPLTIVQATPSKQPEPSEWGFSAPGRIEGTSEIIDLGFPTPGRIVEVMVIEGDRVRTGMVLAELDCADLERRGEAKESELAATKAAYETARIGARPEARQMADAELERAEAVLLNAKREAERKTTLAKAGGAVGESEVDMALRDRDVAVAALEAARMNAALVKAELRPSEVAYWQATVKQLSAELGEIHADIAKCIIRAPLDGTILRVVSKAGTVVSLNPPTTVLRIVDLSSLKVRAEVDERDVAMVHAGQHATILLADGGHQIARGIVEQILPLMGRKSALSNDPSDKADRDIVEVLVLMDKPGPWPIGLRIDVIFEQ